MAVRKSNAAPRSVTLFLALAMLIALASAAVSAEKLAAVRGSKITFPDPCFDACNHENYCTCRTKDSDRELCCRVCRKQCNEDFNGCDSLPVGPPCP